jgi:hypothetical protein
VWPWDQHYWRARCAGETGGGGEQHAVDPAVAARFWAEFVPAVAAAAAAAANAEAEVRQAAITDRIQAPCWPFASDRRRC